MANRNKRTQKKYEKSKQDYKRKASKDYDSKDVKEERVEKKQDTKSWNDAKWYIPDDKIREQVGTYSVATVTGVPTYIEAENAGTTKETRTALRYGSTMEIRLFPFPGVGTGLIDYAQGVSAIDTACRKLYTAISSVNSKTTQYTPESLGIAILAVGELVSLISYATRLYGVAFTYNPRNRHVPKQIISAMGIDPAVLDDLSTYRMQLNKLITAANNIRMIKDLKYFTKCWEIYANYFEDSTSGLAQYYIMRPAGYLKYVETDPTHGELQWVDFGDEITYVSLLHHIQTCLNNLLTSSLMNYVYTDIVNYVLKEGGDLLGFSYVGELYSVLPLNDPTFLTQVHNMTWGMFDLTDYRIYEDTEHLLLKASEFIYTGESAPEATAIASDRLIDFPFTDNPSVDDKIDAIMYTSIVWELDDQLKPLGFAAPDHPVYKVKIHTNEDVITNIPNAVALQDTSFPDYIRLLTSFNVSPYIFTYNDAQYAIGVRPYGSLNYFMTIKYKQLKNIFDFAFLGLFDAEVKSVKPY